MEKLCNIEETLISLVESNLTNSENVHTHEMGEVIDMIKDIEQAKYYASQREKNENEKEKMPMQQQSAT